MGVLPCFIFGFPANQINQKVDSHPQKLIALKSTQPTGSQKSTNNAKLEEKGTSKISKSLAAHREKHDLAFSIGYNMVQTFGRLPYLNLKYDYFFVGSNWFAEADMGIGYYFKEDEYPLYDKSLYRNDLLINLDLTLAHSFGSTKIEYIKNGSKNVVPFVLFGPTLVYQGGFFNPGGVLGIGSIMYSSKESGYTIHYGVKDKVYFPKVHTNNFPTHNIHLYIGIQVRLKS